MQGARLSVTAVASDKVKQQKLNFYINGKISNFERIENVQFSKVDDGSDFIYSLSENMECLIEQSQTVVSVEKELKRYQKKMDGISAGDKRRGFVNCVRGTYDFIYGISDVNEIEFSKDKLFTGMIVTGGVLKAVSTNYNSMYRIRNTRVLNLFEKIEKPSYAVEKQREENYSPSKGVLKEFETDDLKSGDIYVFSTTNTNTRIDSEILEGFADSGNDSEETVWNVVNQAAKHSITDNFIVIAVRIDEPGILGAAVVPADKKPEAESEETGGTTVQKMKSDNTDERKPGIFAAAASIFKSGKSQGEAAEQTESELSTGTAPTAEKEVYESEAGKVYNEYGKKMNFPGVSKEYKKLNIKRPVFMKRRMNIYLKRFISIVIVLLLMAGIVYGMFNLLKLIFTDSDTIEISPTPITSPTPTPEPPTPTPTPTPEPSPSEEPEEAFVVYTVMSGDTLSKISSMFYNGDSNHVAEIAAYNNITDIDSIRVGQVIKIPTLYTADPED
ncbi:MAG: LysM domain-containing protein [Clostridia bacterium]